MKNTTQPEKTKEEVLPVEETPVEEPAMETVEPVSWKNESEDGTVVETKPAQLVCQNCEGGLIDNGGRFDRCSTCLGTGLLGAK